MASLSSEEKKSVHMETALRVHVVMGVALGWCEDATGHPSYHLGETSPTHGHAIGYRFMRMTPPQGHHPAQEGDKTGRDVQGLPRAPRVGLYLAAPRVEPLLDGIHLVPPQHGEKGRDRQAPARPGQGNPITPQGHHTRLRDTEVRHVS